MTTVSTDIAQTNARVGDINKRTVSPSAGSVQESMFDFILDIDPDILSTTDIEVLDTLFNDLDWLHNRGVKEAAHFANRSSRTAKIRARKWYKANRSRVKKLQTKLKRHKGLQKKKEILAKSQRILKKKKKKKYHTLHHSNESQINKILNENIKKGAKKAVDLFPITVYRVVKSFSINSDITAQLYEKIEYEFGRWQLIKRDGLIIKFQVDKKEILPFIKFEAETDLEDII